MADQSEQDNSTNIYRQLKRKIRHDGEEVFDGSDSERMARASSLLYALLRIVHCSSLQY